MLFLFFLGCFELQGLPLLILRRRLRTKNGGLEQGHKKAINHDLFTYLQQCLIVKARNWSPRPYTLVAGPEKLQIGSKQRPGPINECGAWRVAGGVPMCAEWITSEGDRQTLCLWSPAWLSRRRRERRNRRVLAKVLGNPDSFPWNRVECCGWLWWKVRRIGSSGATRGSSGMEWEMTLWKALCKRCSAHTSAPFPLYWCIPLGNDSSVHSALIEPFSNRFPPLCEGAVSSLVSFLYLYELFIHHAIRKFPRIRP